MRKEKYEGSVIYQETIEKLFGSELWLEAILENNLLSIMVLKSLRDKSGTIIDFEFQFANKKAVESVHGRELIGKRLLDEFPYAKPDKIFDNYVYVVETGKSWEDEVYFNPRGYDVWLALKVTRLEDGCLVLYSDITARKNTDQDHFQNRLEMEVEQRTAELKAGKDLMKSIFDSSTIGMSLLKVVRDENGEIIDFQYQLVNKATEEYNNRYDLAGKKYSEIHKGFFKTGLFDNLKKVVETGETGRMELFYDDEGFCHWFRTTGVRFNDGVLLSFEDITVAKNAEAELKEQNHFIKQITDIIPDIMFVADMTGETLIYASKGLSSLGYRQEDIQVFNEEEFKSHLHPDDFFKTEAFNRNLLTIGPEEVRETVFRLSDKKGNYHWLNVRYRLFKALPDGKAAQILGIARDITEKTETELAFREEKTRNMELLRINELMDTFVYAAAHDLKSPVSNLRLLTALISDTEDEKMRLYLQQKYAPIIDILESTISGLVRVLEIEKDSVIGVNTIRFDEAFNQVVRELNDKIVPEKTEIKNDFSACETVLYPHTYLTSIFRTLLSNALKYRQNAKKTVINVKTECSGNFIILIFTDNGIGIDLENFGKDMFKPFKRFSTHIEGSGLGLHLVKSIVTKNGGRIEIDSKPGQGTAFRIFLVQYSN